MRKVFVSAMRFTVTQEGLYLPPNSLMTDCECDRFLLGGKSLSYIYKSWKQAQFLSWSVAVFCVDVVSCLKITENLMAVLYQEEVT